MATTDLDAIRLSTRHSDIIRMLADTITVMHLVLPPDRLRQLGQRLQFDEDLGNPGGLAADLGSMLEQVAAGDWDGAIVRLEELDAVARDARNEAEPGGDASDVATTDVEDGLARLADWLRLQ